MSENYYNIKPGWRIKLAFGNSNDRLYHVTGIIDNRLVLKWWSRHKQRFIYEIQDYYWYAAMRSYMKIDKKIKDPMKRAVSRMLGEI